MTDSRVKTLSESIYLTLIARISMAMLIPVMGVTGWLALDWLDKRFDSVAVPLKVVESRVDTQESRSQAKALLLQNHDLRIDNLEKDGGDLTQEVKDLGKVVSDVNTSLKSLVRVLEDRDRRRTDISP